ncbi:MAG: peptidase [Gammaproteobacteria bacterium]|nr:peptidase [Gammaproteobacteria bacterium]
MTYCVGIQLNTGLVFASDSRTNAGVDNIRIHSKIHPFIREGEVMLVLLSSGNLATSQSVVNQIKKDLKNPDAKTSLFTAEDMAEACNYVGEVNRKVQKQYDFEDQQAGFNVEATFILGGQIRHEQPKLALIYPQGNYLLATEETPFFQIGESKYGKTILDRIIEPSVSLEDAARCALVSLDSTSRSNVGVGPPFELIMYRKDSLRIDNRFKYDLDSNYYKQLRQAWAENLRAAFYSLPRFDWERHD